MRGPYESSPEPEPELSEIEWLDGGPSDPARPPRIPRIAWYALIGVAIAAVVIALTVGRGGSAHRTARSSTPALTPTPSPPSPPLTPSRSVPADPPSTGPSVTVRDAGRPLLDVPRGVDLFAWDGDDLLRLELATGRVTRTAGILLATSGPLSMVPTRHALLMLSGDPGAGIVVPDGRVPGPLRVHTTRSGGALLPGPDPDHAWLVTYDDPQARLIGPDGRPTGVTMPTGDTSDGTGNLLNHLTGGVYLARPGMPLLRVTSGALLAVGPTRWLTEECDAQHRCTLDVVDRATGAHRVLRPASDVLDPLGVISPDGAVAAMVHLDDTHSTATLRLVDLATGAVRASVPVSANQDYYGGPQVWTPDSRWLLAIDRSGRVIAIDRSGHTKALTGRYSLISALALRTQ